MSTKIMPTKDYSLFIENKFQREHHEVAKPKAYKDLRSSMEIHGWKKHYPMLVKKLRTGKYEILRGHNRFRIAQILGITVWFLVVDAEDDTPIWEMELTEPGCGEKWSLKDALISFRKLGKNPNYALLLEYMTNTGMTASASLKLFTYNPYGESWEVRPSAAVTSETKKGRLKFTSPTLAEEVGSIIKYCKFSLGLSYATRDGFVDTICLIVRSKVVPIETLIRRMKKNIDELQTRVLREDYFKTLTKVYNKKQKGAYVDLYAGVKNFIKKERVLRGKELNKPSTSSQLTEHSTGEAIAAKAAT